jgi:hypothetical protein
MTHRNTQAYLDTIAAQLNTRRDEAIPTYSNPFDDDDFDGNDDHIDCLKDRLSEALAALRTMREAYGTLHDEVSELVESGANLTHDSSQLLADQLAACVSADQEAASILGQYPDDTRDEDWLDDTENADTLADWRNEVAAGDTSRDYQDWLASRREQNADRRAYLAKQNR